MHGKEKIAKILNRKSDKNGFWHGLAHPKSLDGLNKYFNVNGDYELGIKLKDTLCWRAASPWRHPQKLPMFDAKRDGRGVFANASLADIEKFHWPDPKYLDFSETIESIDQIINDGMAVFSGMWSPLVNYAIDFFGMENFFVKMLHEPLIVEAVMERMCNFLYETNEKLYDLAGDKIDVFFFASDLGTQLDLLISPDLVDKFFIPYIARLTEGAKRRGYRVAFHSCGAVSKIIPRLIDVGIDILHPIQARAKDMGAKELARQYNKKLIFMGGVDTQVLLPFKSPSDVKEEVKKLIDLFGPNYIVSPSHESIMPEVPPENIEAMAEAAEGI